MNLPNQIENISIARGLRRHPAPVRGENARMKQQIKHNQ